MIDILTEDVIKNIIKSEKKCTYLNDNYVILYKYMEVPDEKLEDYLEKIRLAQASGINIPKVVDYKLLGKSVGNISKGLFIEERAKGNVLNIRGIVLKDNEDYDLNSIISIYLEKVETYLEELEIRANAPQKFYNKFLLDFINLHKFGLKPDPNSLNYLFDKKIGYTIIDPYPNESKIINKKDLFKYIINDIYGVGRPAILIKKGKLEGFYYLPESLKERIDTTSKKLNKKIYQAFLQAGFNEDYIISNLEQNKQRFKTEAESLDFTSLVIKLEEQLQSEEIKKSTK